MNTRKIEATIRDAYEKDGVAAACNEANKHEICSYEVCNFCDTEVPTIKGDHVCLICGSQTRNELQEEIEKDNI
jgi:hypothetical protein